MKFQKWELCERFCFVRGNTSMGGSCINRELEILDMYHRGWQTLSLQSYILQSCREFLGFVPYYCVSCLKCLAVC